MTFSQIETTSTRDTRSGPVYVTLKVDFLSSEFQSTKECLDYLYNEIQAAGGVDGYMKQITDEIIERNKK